MHNQPVNTQSEGSEGEGLEPKKITLQVSKVQIPMRIDQYLPDRLKMPRATRFRRPLKMAGFW